MTAFWLNVIWMMASQLWWEKSQGNLELYFAAPMSIMSVLFGMAVGGMVMSSTRASIVLVIATLIFGVEFAVDQWLLLLAVFFLTLAALYGLGMMLASLFLMWGREAWHLTQLLVEPVYFVSGLNFPVGRLGVLGSVAISILPLAVGLDAMRQLAFADAAYPAGTPLVRSTRPFHDRSANNDVFWGASIHWMARTKRPVPGRMLSGTSTRNTTVPSERTTHVWSSSTREGPDSAESK